MKLKKLTIVFLGAGFMIAGALSGCATGPNRIDEQNPTVSYSYHYGELEEAKQQAAKYCHENYGRAARVIADEDAGDERIMTFECVVL
jgi:hypothetical protein